MSRPDFSTRRSFPGTVGGPFEAVIQLFDRIERIPAVPFAGLLLLVALLPTAGDWPLSLAFWLFTLGDWALLAALPWAGRSYGPPKASVLLLALLRTPGMLLPLPWSLVGQAVGTALVIYGFWIEPQWLSFTRQTLESPRLKSAVPLRILHFGDLHMERFTARERKLLDLARSTRPDLILFSGDFLSYSYVEDPAAHADARRVLSELDAPLGVYSVVGSPPVDQPERVGRLLDGTSVRWLRDERVTLEHGGAQFDLVGVSCTHRPFVDGPKLLSALDGSPERFTILLYHTPDLAPDAAEAGIDLQLSGHTHGGQVRLPLFGALYASSLYGKRYEVGRRQVGDMALYVTRGVGLEGKGAPRVRFLCRPEVTLWEINPRRKT